MMKKEKGTHRSMGKVGGASEGLENGLASVEKFKTGKGVEICKGTERPKAKKGGSIAV